MNKINEDLVTIVNKEILHTTGERQPKKKFGKNLGTS